MKFRELLEGLQKLSDDKIDDFIRNEWGEAFTYKYHPEAAVELAKILHDVLISPDRKFMHIPGTLPAKMSSEVSKIETKYNLKEVE